MSDFFFVAFSCGGRTRHRLLANALTLVKELRPGACRVQPKTKSSPWAAVVAEAGLEHATSRL